MNKRINMQAQGGFTLIELIVVIVILGILAATALPKFTNLSGEARLASLNAARGALVSTAAMTHGKFLASPTSVTGTGSSAVMNVEGVNVKFDTATGYPAADGTFADAAGLSENDYVRYTTTATDGSTPTITAGDLVLIPKSIDKTPTGKKCYVLIKAAASGGAPTISVGTAAAPATVADCQ